VDKSNEPSRQPVVLLVDDHRDTREMYSQALQLLGYTTHEAGDGFGAWEKARAILPDVIVTDVGLPRMDGIELCGRLKGDNLTSHIPIIALTGFGEAAIAERARKLGVARLLVKPCSPDLLLAEIQAVCSSETDG
jgi:CheY-like chemotaxis protein